VVVVAVVVRGRGRGRGRGRVGGRRGRGRGRGRVGGRRGRGRRGRKTRKLLKRSGVMELKECLNQDTFPKGKN